MKKYLVFFLLLTGIFLGARAAGMSGGSYSSPLTSITPAGGAGSSAFYSHIAVVGAPGTGKSGSSSYSSTSGNGIGVVIITGSASAPVIANIRIDGSSIATGDYVKGGGTLTATVTPDSGTSIDNNASSVEVDGVFTAFSALTGSSSYNTTTNVLTFALGLTSDGDHAISIHAADTAGQSAVAAMSVKVDSGALKAVSVCGYPNPYNPNNGNMRIAFQLNNDADTSVYIFNAIGELIYRRNYASGSSGGMAGYNEVAWDGRSDFGSIAGNDIYFLRVVSGGRPVGRTKIAVIK